MKEKQHVRRRKSIKSDLNAYSNEKIMNSFSIYSTHVSPLNEFMGKTFMKLFFVDVLLFLDTD